MNAIITGGTRGIGLAIAKEFADRGDRVAVTYRGNEEAAREAMKVLGSGALLIKSDAADMEQATGAAKEVLEAFGTVDILVNNAGITKDKLIMRMSAEDFSDVIDTNLCGAFNMLKAVVPGMIKKRYGRIINLSSIVALNGNKGQANYTASKAGIIGLTKTAARELGSRGITVNAIAPGFIETEMTGVLSEKIREEMIGAISLGRPGKPEDVAKVAAFLASDDAAFVTGQVIGVDGGMVA